MTRDQFAAAYDVSRETIERFDTYESLLKKWNKAVNLVAKPTIGDVFGRHFADSAQLFSLAPDAQSWIDIGSGAGFPGLVIAFLAAEKNPSLKIHLIESDKRKCVFLREVARACSVDATIIDARIEDIEFKAEIVSARALAPLPDLLAMAKNLLLPGGKALFLKGETVDEELTVTHRLWHTALTKHPSRTDPRGTVLEIGSFHRRIGA